MDFSTFRRFDLSLAFALACAVQAAGRSAQQTSSTQARPDAVIELWEQNWTVQPDGSIELHVKQHVQLNSDRAHGEFADPRITYNADYQKLEILNSRTRLPGGGYRELPEYGHVLVAPDASAGWPAYAGIRQHLLVKSGIEPGCVVELEYRITTRPGACPFLAADQRLDHSYPIQRRVVAIKAPRGVRYHATNVPQSAIRSTPDSLRIELTNVPAAVDEPQALPWQHRCPRVAFTTSDSAFWLKHRLEQVTTAADDAAPIVTLAADWTKGAPDASSKLRALQEKLAATFNFVDFATEWHPPTVRNASAVLSDNYGLPIEAAAVMLALAKAVKLDVAPAILVSDDAWLADAAQDSMAAAYLVRLNADNPQTPAELWHPQRGRVRREGGWAGYMLLTDPAKLDGERWKPWDDPAQSVCRVHGKITVKEDGSYAGTLTLRTSGVFAGSEGLRSGDAQKGRIGALVGHLLPGATVDSFAVNHLAPGVFEATAQVKSSKALKKLGDKQMLVLAGDGPASTTVSMPLTYSRRESAVHLSAAYDEEIDLTLEWPEKWRLEIEPAALDRVEGRWGFVAQTAEVQKNALRLTRDTRIAQRDIDPQDFMTLREAMNRLRADAWRTLVFAPQKADTTVAHGKP